MQAIVRFRPVKQLARECGKILQDLGLIVLPLARDFERPIKYVSHYMQGTAISNGRILADDGAKVTFGAKDYRHGGTPIRVTVSGPEFVRRFLLHVLPRRFSRIRYFGILSRRSKKVDLPLCRRLLEAAGTSAVSTIADTAGGAVKAEHGDTPERVDQVDQIDQVKEQAEPESVARCQGCGRRGTLRWRGEIPGSTGWQRFCGLLPRATRRRLAAEEAQAAEPARARWTVRPP